MKRDVAYDTHYREHSRGRRTTGKRGTRTGFVLNRTILATLHNLRAAGEVLSATDVAARFALDERTAADYLDASGGSV